MNGIGLSASICKAFGAVNTDQAGAQAEDGGELAPGVDVSAEEAVAHISRLVEGRVRGAPRLRSQVCHRVRGGDEVGVCGQIEMESVPERINPVVKPQTRQVITQTSPSPSEVQLVWKGLSEVIDPERTDDFVR